MKICLEKKTASKSMKAADNIERGKDETEFEDEPTLKNEKKRVRTSLANMSMIDEMIRDVNPVNMWHTARQYGYKLSIWTVITYYACMLLFVFAVTYFYKADWVIMIPAFLVAIAITPIALVGRYKKNWQKKRFEETTLYVGQMLYAFNEKRRVRLALEETLEIFRPESHMHKTIKKGLDHWDKTFNDSEIASTVLHMIEKEYQCDKIENAHKLFIKQELHGGECKESIDALLMDIDLWQQSTEEFMMDTKKKFIDIIIEIFGITGLAIIDLYLLQQTFTAFDTKSVPIYSVIACFMTAAMLVIYVFSDRKTCINWLDKEKKAKADLVKKQYKQFMNYDPKKEFKFSVLYSLIGVAIFGFGLYRQSILYAVAGVGLFLLLLNQHTIGHNLDKLALTKEFKKAFPAWIMEMALLVQGDTVMNALRKTSETAAYVMRPALNDLIEEIKKSPENPEPYNNFLSSFEITEIHASMKTLYTMAIGSSGDPERQIAELIKKNNALSVKAEKLANEDGLGNMRMYYALPMAIGMVKLLSDMIIFIMLFMTNVGI